MYAFLMMLGGMDTTSGFTEMCCCACAKTPVASAVDRRP
ncbi:hypothetical protein I553_4984 [Mycobacterium xenopi 4042]|uniref:Uncharacterized protein n=1 Tax=Mycobacterium xenopi 4042 TaxID=1299334 RepID=X8AFN6_MYCXE|nr:hypothetical protein I553_4984 [Mycobacterium xenopi 4042]